MPDTRDLTLVLAGGVPLVAMETHDEARAIELLARVAREQERDLFQWTCTDGLRRVGFGLQVEQPAEHAEAEAVLRFLKERAGPGIYALCDFHHWLAAEQPRIIRLLKDVALRQGTASATLVLISHRLPLPPELSRLAARFETALPDEAQLRGILRDEARHWARLKPTAKVRSDDATLQRLVANLRGLHLARRGLAPGRFDLPRLASLGEQCSGAELEQAIVSAHYGALAREVELDQDALAAELLRTTPLATLLAERIQGLWDWAKERGVQPA